jgi:signal transduction histidine kinase
LLPRFDIVTRGSFIGPVVRNVTRRAPRPPRLTAWIERKPTARQAGAFTRFARKQTLPCPEDGDRKNDLCDRPAQGELTMVTTDEVGRGECEPGSEASWSKPSAHGASAQSLTGLHPGKIERLAAVGMFATGVVHELLSPIASIRMAAQHAQEITDPERHRKILAAIVEASDRCRRAVEGVMRFVKDDVADKRPVDITDVIHRAVGIVQSETDELDAQVEVHEPALTVPCDSLGVEQVFVSLLRNAVQSSPTAKTMAIRCVREEGSAVITFTDDGPSIDDTDLERIFEPFYAARDRGGNGLGLALARRIVSAHGGTIRAIAGATSGARFEVRLPLV